MTEGTPYSVNLDPQTTENLVDDGGAVLILGLPPGTAFGIDHQVFQTGPLFKGLKMIPPGPHFITYRVSSQRSPNDFSPPSGRWVFLKSRQVEVWRYDESTEELEPLSEPDEADRFADGVRRHDFDKGMAPYDLSRAGQWKLLAQFVSDAVIRKLSPIGGVISIMAEAASTGTEGESDILRNPKTPAEKLLAEQLAQGRLAKDAADHSHTKSIGSLIQPETSTNDRRDNDSCYSSNTAGEEKEKEKVKEKEEEEEEEERNLSLVRSSQGGVTIASSVAQLAISDSQLSSPNRETEGAALQSLPSETASPGVIPTSSPSPLEASTPRQLAAMPPSPSTPATSAPSAESSEAAAGVVAATKGSSGRCFYSAIPRLIHGKSGLAAAAITALNLDRTHVVDKIVADRYGGKWSGIVGELQFAFVNFVYGQSLDGFSQWKLLLNLFLNCDSGPLGEQSDLWASVLEAVAAQLSIGIAGASPFESPSSKKASAKIPSEGGLESAALGESLVDDLLPDSALRGAFAGFFEALEESHSEATPRILRAAKVLKEQLARHLGWTFGFGDLSMEGLDEDGPVLVEC